MTSTPWAAMLIVGSAISAAIVTAKAQNPQVQVPAGSKAVISGPVGPSPYNVIRGWHKPFAQPGFAFGGNSGVFAESPNRIFVAQRGETRLPSPLPPEFA